MYIFIFTPEGVQGISKHAASPARMQACLMVIGAGVAGGVGGVFAVPATAKLAKRLLPNGFAGAEAPGNEVGEA